MALLARGFWPIVIQPKGAKVGPKDPKTGEQRIAGGKEPIGAGWGLERWTIDRAHRAFKDRQGAGVGICFGPGRGPDGQWLIDIEGDGPEAEASRLILFGGEVADTLGWRSARGSHQAFLADPARLDAIMPGLVHLEEKGQGRTGVFKSDQLPGLELRLGGYKPDRTVKQVQSVVPPTVGTDDKPRQWTGGPEVARVPDAFYDVLGSLVMKPEPTPQPGPRKATSKGEGSGKWTPEQRAVAYLEKCEPAISGQAGHSKAFKAACKVGPGFDLQPETLLHLLQLVWNPSCDPPWSDGELRHKVEEAYRVETRRGWMFEGDEARTRASANPRPKPGPSGEPVGPKGVYTPPGDDGIEPPQGGDAGGPAKGEAGPERVAIEASTDRHIVVGHSIRALTADPDLYRRGDQLVTVVREDSNLIHLTTLTTMEGVAGSPRVLPLAEGVIGERLTKVAEFFQWRKDRSGEAFSTPVHPPDWLVRNIATRKSWPGIRPLVAVAECPFPRRDGSIVEEPGYDPETAILYAPSMEFPPVPPEPTRDDATAAWSRIRQKVRHYPFAGEDDEVVFLAGMLNVIARHGIVGPMPGVAINGNKAGIGKGYLVDAMVIPGTGRIAPISKYPHDPVEAGKVKTSIVRSGKSIVSFDNLAIGTSYGGEDVDSLITARLTDDRILGGSDQTGELIVRVACFVNGNNIQPVKDAHRRWIVCNLVTDDEHPERRDIRDSDGNQEKTPDVLMMEDRADVVRDGLIILRSHALAGWPNDGWAPLGSFTHWDKVVRGAVWFATGRDCTATQMQAEEQSSEHLQKVAFLEGLWEMPGAKEGERGVTSAEAYKMAVDFPDKYPTMQQALMTAGRGGKPADSRTLGNILAGLKNDPVGGYKLIKHPRPRHKSTSWIVLKTRPDEGGSGGSGGSVSNPPCEDYDSDSDTITTTDDRVPY